MPPDLAATCNVVYFPQLGYFVAVTREHEQMYEYNLGLPPDFRLQVWIFSYTMMMKQSHKLSVARSSQPTPMHISRMIALMVRDAGKTVMLSDFHTSWIPELDESLGDNHGMILGKWMMMAYLAWTCINIYFIRQRNRASSIFDWRVIDLFHWSLGYGWCMCWARLVRWFACHSI